MNTRLRTIHGLGTVLALAGLATAGGGCTSSNHAGTPIVDAFTASITLTCTESPWSGVFVQGSSTVSHVNALGGCSLSGANDLSVTFTDNGYDQIGINIAGMTGPGTYSTDNTEATEVWMNSGTGDNPGGGTSVENAGGIGPPPDETPYPARDYPCTIVVQTNLLDVTRTPGETVPFAISLDVTCPTLGTVGNFPIDCDLSPATFHFAVAACNASL
jgi:hypothetical protein